MDLRTDAFPHEGMIPDRLTGAGPFPAFRWSGVPPGAVSLAFLVEDPDAPGETWIHGLLYDLPADLPGLEEGQVPAGAKQGLNSWGNLGYGAPAPPPGRPHRYFFRVYALDRFLGLPAGADRGALDRAMKGHILAQGVWMGRYGR